jgi:PST family polysaccharide transporter
MPFSSLLRRNSVRRDAAMLLSAQVFYRLGGVVFLVVLSRRLPVSTIGVFSFCESLADAAIIIATLSLEVVVNRQVAAEPKQAAAHLAPLLGFRLISGPIYLAVLAIIGLFLHGAARWALPLVGIYTLCESLYFTMAGVFINLRRVDFNVSIGLAAEVLFLALFLGGMFWLPALGTVIAACLLRMFFLVAASLIVMRRCIGPLRLGWDNNLIRASIPFMLMLFLNLMQGKSETMLLGIFSTYAAVGAYSLALRLLVASNFVPQAMASALFSRLAGEGMTPNNRRQLTSSLATIAGIGLLGALILALCPSPFTRLLYGNAAAQVTPIARALAVALPIRFLAVFMTSSLAALKREKQILKAMFVGLVVGTLADLILIPPFGAIGAASGLTIGSAVQCAMLAGELARVLRGVGEVTGGNVVMAAMANG